MSKLNWDEDGQRLWETGIKKVALYVHDRDTSTYGTGIAWNGVQTLNESPSGAEATALYADDIKYGEIRSSEEFGGTIECYTFPPEFKACDGGASPVAGMKIGQQTRTKFGLAYVSTIGNDEDGIDHGYKLHLVYNATASPAERSHATINESPEAETISYEFTTTPVTVGTINGVAYKPTSHIEIDSTQFTEAKMNSLMDKIFGRDADGDITALEPTLLTPSQVYATLTAQG